MSDDVTERRSFLQEVEREELQAAFRSIFARADGKRVIFWMLEQCAIYRDAYTGESNSTNYVLGMQAAGRLVIGKLDEIDPAFYPTLLLAMKEIRETDKAAAQSRAEQMEPEDDAEIA